MRWYHIETQDRDLRDHFLRGLRLTGIYYEVTSLPGGWRIAVRAAKARRHGRGQRPPEKGR